MPKRNACASPYYIRRSPRQRLIPPTTYYGSGLTAENPIVINDTENIAEAVDMGSVQPQPPNIPRTDMGTQIPQELLDREHTILSDVELDVELVSSRVSQGAHPPDVDATSSTFRQDIFPLPFLIRNIVNNYWWDDDDEPVPAECIPSLTAALYAVRKAKFDMACARVRINLGILRRFRPASSDGSVTLGSQDSTRSGDVDEYRMVQSFDNNKQQQELLDQETDEDVI
jgi:hypothetical protein